MLSNPVGDGEQIGMGDRVRHAELLKPALTLAQHLARPAQAQVFFRNHKAVIGFAQDFQP